MLVLMNSTKTMDLAGTAPARLTLTEPRFAATAAELVRPLRRLSRAKLAAAMALGPELARTTQTDLAVWGEDGRPAAPALATFTGLVYKYVDAPSLSIPRWRDAQKRLRILSGLYGVLRPLDRVEAYRLEMGCRFQPRRAINLAAFWKEAVTGALNDDLKHGEAVLNLAAQEYLKAVDVAALAGPVISPVFKESRADGTLKNASVHAKMARGAMARFILTAAVKKPADLLAFAQMGWEASCEPPPDGPWLFTRPARD